MRVLVATRNAGKVRELQRLLGPLTRYGVELVGVDRFPGAPDVVEDADSFEGNASKKALETARVVGLPTLADDSGLVVDALGGAPGIRSARFAGLHGDDAANNAKLLADLEGVDEGRRTARFGCALAFADPAGPLGDAVKIERGEVEGRLLRTGRGAGGFGYDPLFVPVGETRTTAEMPADEKNLISHRAVAVTKLLPFLLGYLGPG